MHTTYYIILIISTALFALIATAGITMLLSKMNILDLPNERSNHAVPVPTGVGLGFMVVCIGFLMVANAPMGILLPALMLCVVSFMDDRQSLPVIKRLGFQAIAVIIAIGSVKGSVFQGIIPYWMEAVVLFGAWMWFINLYNFMDGIDEITATETISITAGLLIIAVITDVMPRYISIDSSIVMAAVLGFLPFNKHPAHAFMGDAGSVTLGFLVADILFNLAASGHWVAALILPAYYLSDASITLVKRAIAGKAIWKAHSEHFYQKAVRSGRTHSQVVKEIAVLNSVLVLLALASFYDVAAGYAALGIAYVATFFVLYRFTKQQIESIPANPVASGVTDVQAH